jgi:signal transduction histidine kinase
MRNTNGKLHLEIRDNGRGFDPAAVQRGNGLGNMQRRAERLGGRLHIESLPGKGASVRIEI